MRVVHVVLTLNVGGLERGVLNQLREGRKLGQTVSVICVEEFGELADQARATGAQLICLNKQPGIRLSTFQRCRGALRSLSPDVVHTHHIAALFYAGPVARRLRVPLIVHTEHGRKDYAGRFRTRMLGRWAARYTQRFYCLTEDMAAWVRQHRITPPHKVKVIFNGIDTAVYARACDSAPLRRELGIPAGAPVIGTIGRLNEIKRQDVLLRAFAKVRGEIPEAHLVIVGDGPLRNELRALAAELGIAGSTHFAGYRSDTTAFLHAMDVFVLTSRSEGMPQAALEASSAGLPVVATRVGGLPELIEHGRTGLLVPPGDEAAVAEGIRSVLRDPTAARAMGRQAHERVTGMFDVKQMAAVYHRDFLDMLSPNAPGTDARAGARRLGEVRCA